MSELLPARDVARPRNVPDWIVDQLDAYTAMSSRRGPTKALDDMAELRRQQAAFHRTVADQDRQNWPIALAATLPVGALFAPFVAESALAAAIGGAAATVARKGPLQFVRPGITNLKGGDNFYAQAGRRADAAFKSRFKAKGWRAQGTIAGTRLRPDATILSKKPGSPKDWAYVELKPNTPSGRASGARQIQTYIKAGERNKGRVIYYEPADFYHGP